MGEPLDRRKFLGSMGALCCGALSGGLSQAQSVSTDPRHSRDQGGVDDAGKGSSALTTASMEELILEHARAFAAKAKPLRILIPKGCHANIEPATKGFELATGVPIKLLEVPVDDVNSTILLRTQAKQVHYDLALPATFGIPELVEGGCFLPLDELAKAYEPPGYSDTALYHVGNRYRGKLYGYQTDGDTYLMFYNQNLLTDPAQSKSFEDHHGYEPSIPQTWEQLDRLLEHYHRPSAGQFGGTLFRSTSYMVWEWWVRFHAKGFYPFGESLEPRIAEPAGVKALEELVHASRYQYPFATSNGLFENWKAFGEGKALVNIGWGGTQKYLRAKTRLRGKLGFGEAPGGEISGKSIAMPYFNWGWNYVVSASTSQPELSYLLALFACSPKTSTAAVRASDGFFDPFREEHYSDPGIVETYSSEFLDVHRKSMSAALPDLYLDGRGEYFQALRFAISRANSGQAKPQEALATAATQWKQITRRRGPEAQLEQWTALRKSYPPQLRALLK